MLGKYDDTFSAHTVISFKKVNTRIRVQVFVV